jgi:molybdopterin converting factor small subunit
VGCDISDIKLPSDTGTASGQDPGQWVSIGFYGSIREAAQVQTKAVSLDCEKTVTSILKMLADTYGEVFAKEIFSPENPGILREDVMLTLNRKILHHSKVDSTTLKDGDTLEIFPIFPGGG